MLERRGTQAVGETAAGGGRRCRGFLPGTVHRMRGCPLAVALSLLLAAGAAAQTAPPVRIAGVVYLGDLPTVVAREEGLFRRHGLDARVELNDSGRDNLQRLRAGETDFALMALTPLVLDALADPDPGGADDPVILASLVHSTRLNHVVTLAGRGIATAADLAGRRLGLARGTNAEFVWWLFAHFHDLDPGTVELVDLAVAALPQALAKGTVDAAVVWEPWTSRLREAQGPALREFDGSNIYAAKWVLVASRRLVASRPERVQGVLASYRAAIEFIERRPEAALAHYTGLTGRTPRPPAAGGPLVDYQLSLDWSLIATLQEQLRWARTAGHGPASTAGVAVPALLNAAPLRRLQPTAVSLPASLGTEPSRP